MSRFASTRSEVKRFISSVTGAHSLSIDELRAVLRFGGFSLEDPVVVRRLIQKSPGQPEAHIDRGRKDRPLCRRRAR